MVQVMYMQMKMNQMNTKSKKDMVVLGMQMKWWKTKRNYYDVRGTFNTELYNRILEIKSK